MEITYDWSFTFTVTLCFYSYPEQRPKVADRVCRACATLVFSPRSWALPSCPIRGPLGVYRLGLAYPGFVYGTGFVPTAALKSTVPRVTRFQSGFVGSPNKLAHALNGSYAVWDAPLPPPNTWKWKQSFFIPNGVRIFDYQFYGRECLWIHFIRRAKPSYMNVSRYDSPRLYGITLRAVASRGGGPGCRWHSESKRLWRQSMSTLPSKNTYDRNPLTETTDDGDNTQWNIDTNGFSPERDGHRAELDELQQSSQRGYQNRDTHGGSSRGVRSQAAKSRRHDRWKQKQLASRQDYRQWESQQTGSTLRTHGGSFLKPPTCSQPTIDRLMHISRKADCNFNQLRYCDKQSAPSLPSGFFANAGRAIYAARALAPALSWLGLYKWRNMGSVVLPHSC